MLAQLADTFEESPSVAPEAVYKPEVTGIDDESVFESSFENALMTP